MMLISTKKKRSQGDAGVGVGYSLKGPKRVCAAEKVMVFGVLSLKQGIQFNCLRRLAMNDLLLW